jgi:hypothetical protein
MYSSSPSPDGFSGIQTGGVGNVPEALIREVESRYKPRPVRGRKPAASPMPAGPSPDGFAGVDTSEMGTLRKRSDSNRQAADARLRRDNPGAMIQSGQAVIKKPGGGFQVLDRVTKEELNKGMPQPSGKRNSPRKAAAKPSSGSEAKPTGGSSALPSLEPGDDIPASQYPAGVTAPSGRGETRTSATGVTQKGTNTGYKPMTLSQANGLLSDGYTVEDPFSSNQLPGTATNLYKTEPQTEMFEAGKNLGINTGASQQRLTRDLYNEGGAVAFGKATADFPTSDYIEQVQTQGSADLVQSGAEGKTDWLNRSMADNSDKNLARRRAFLDAESSTQGLRDAESTLGIVYAGGQHHMLNPNRSKEGQNDFVAIDDKDDVRGYKSGRLSAEDLKNRYVSGVGEGMKSGEFPVNTPNLDVQSEQPAAVTPVDTSTEQSFTVPDNTKETVSKLAKLKSNLFR